MGALSLRQVGAKKPLAIPLKWKLDSAGYLVTVLPTVALSDVADYVLEIEDPAVDVARSKTVFRFGHLLRIRYVQFGSTKKGGAIDMVGIEFSENVQPKKVAAGLSARVAGGQALGLSLFSTGDSVRTSVYFNLGQSIAANESVELRLKSDLGAAAGALDGKMTGKAGSGEFVLTIQPSKYGANQRWVPPVPAL